MRTTPFKRTALILLLAAALPALNAHAAEENDGSLAELGLEDLMKVQVLTASRKAQSLHDTAAAVFVVTGEEIQRSGALTIPDALRMVPGVQVAQISNNKWVVTARGFGGRFSNKLQVLVDGRSLYSPLFSGVLWEDQDIMLEDIQRIEVIRGPGAAMWGANAVNGVINIITKKARDTQGTLVSLAAGTIVNSAFSVRHGVAIDENTHMRFFAKSKNVGASDAVDGSEGQDTWRNRRAGFRLDRRNSGGGQLMVSGDAYYSDAGDRWSFPTLSAPYMAAENYRQRDNGGSLQVRYEWGLDDGSEMTLQAYGTHNRVGAGTTLAEKRDTFDIDFQHRRQFASGHDVMWGLGYRHTRDRIDASNFAAVPVSQRSNMLWSAFIQDEITLVPERWRLTLGTKLEHNSRFGFEPQPNARLLWTPTLNDSIWMAVSRAVRTPSRAETDFNIRLATIPAGTPGLNPSPFPMVIGPWRVDGQSTMEAEKVSVFETGYRRQVNARLSLDGALFVAKNRDLRGGSPGQPFLVMGQQPYLWLPYAANNPTDAITSGVELAADWRPFDHTRVQFAYTHLKMRMNYRGQTVDGSDNVAGQSPRNQFSLRVGRDFGQGQSLDAWVRRVSALNCWNQASMSGINANADAYTSVDVRYAIRLGKQTEISLVGQNLLDKRHVEFFSDYLNSQGVYVGRSGYVKLRWEH